jgi:hypothetical protein
MFLVRPVRCAHCLRRRYVCLWVNVPPLLIPSAILAGCFVLLFVGFSPGHKSEHSTGDEPPRKIAEREILQGSPVVGNPWADVEGYLDRIDLPTPPHNMPASGEYPTKGKPAERIEDVFSAK